jgi:hypothetical protein
MKFFRLRQPPTALSGILAQIASVRSSAAILLDQMTAD